jgi:tetrapyrrole methylase family protein/MazG family protein
VVIFFLLSSTMAPRKRPLRKSKSRKSKRTAAAPGRAFEELVAVMARLRAPDGCPWDREQSHTTLRTYLIEEAYEVLDALDSGDDAKFADELGDLLLQVLFHAQIAAEGKRFAIQDVIGAIHDKMIRRHPHVFGKTRAKTSDEVLRNWELLKKEERAASANVAETTKTEKTAKTESIINGVPRTLPALMEAFQLTRKAARVGFDWDSAEGIFAKLEEEAAELRAALKSKESPAHIESEMGDILFAAVNLARFLKIDPELALKKSSQKFSRRFREMERLARQQGAGFADVPRPQMESLWEKSKLADPASR